MVYKLESCFFFSNFFLFCFKSSRDWLIQAAILSPKEIRFCYVCSGVTSLLTIYSHSLIHLFIHSLNSRVCWPSYGYLQQIQSWDLVSVLKEGPVCSPNMLLCLVTQSCLTFCNPLNCSPPGSSVHGTFQARILEWVAISSSRRSFWPRDWTQVSCIAGGFLTCGALNE